MSPIFRRLALCLLGPGLGSALVGSLQAQVSVQATVTPLIGRFQYEISVHNPGPNDLTIVSLMDAPVADPLIDPTLSVPAGFLSNYDEGLGIVDFIEFTTTFGAGNTVAGFSFESLAAPGPNFAQFQALDILGNLSSGRVDFVQVPEPGTLLAAAIVPGLIFVQYLRRRSGPEVR